MPNENIKGIDFTVHPAGGRPGGVLLVVGVLGFVIYVTWQLFFQPVMVVSMVTLYVFQLAAFLFPSHYTADDDGITLTRLGIRHVFPWTRFRRYSLERGGLFLSPSLKKSSVERIRGVFLVMEKSQQEALKPLLEARVVGRSEAA